MLINLTSVKKNYSKKSSTRSKLVVFSVIKSNNSFIDNKKHFLKIMNDQVLIKILFFAKSREIAGISETNLKVENKISGQQLLDLICCNYGLEIIKKSLILAINEEYVENLETVIDIKHNDIIAIVPPISGG